MKTLLLLLLPLFSFGQTYKIIDGKEYVVTPIDSAAKIAYWGEKGVECEPLIDSMEVKAELQENAISLQFTVNSNLKKAQEEYRTNLTNCAQRNADLEKENGKLTESKEEWKDKAKRRGKTLWLIAGTAVTVVTVVLITSITAN